MFEFAVAAAVFGEDNAGMSSRPWYRLRICSAEPQRVETDAGLHLEVRSGLGCLRRATTVVVPPTRTPERVPEAVYQALRAAHRGGARILSLCTGAFVLAEAGLLNGRHATTHWTECADLARLFPGIAVDPDVLYVDDGDILTSAGSAASIDLCLHVVRRDHGAAVAAQVARQLVVPPYREGGQAQFIDTPVPAIDGRDPFDDTMTWAQEHLHSHLAVAELARRSAMSPRTFARRFAAQTGTTPYRWLVRQRLQLAQRLLETTDFSMDLVAERSGFVTAANLRKHFGRQLRTSPHAYRSTFRGRLAEGMADV